MDAKKVIKSAINDAKSTIKDAKDFAEASVALAKMKTADKASTAMTNTIAYIAVAIVSLYILLFIGLTLGFALGSWLGNNAWGFLIVTGLFIALGATVYLLKDKLIKLPILNTLLDKLFNKGEKDESTEGLKRI